MIKIKITKIEQQKKRKNRYSIFVDDEFAFGVDEEVLMKYSLKKGMELDDHEIEQVIKAEEQSKANNYALNLLSYRARSEKEIRDKLRRKGYEDNYIENTIEFLYRYNYINDLEFGMLFAKDRQNFKKAGKRVIMNELYQKGVDKEVISQIIDEIIDPNEELQRALELAEKKAVSYKNDDRNAKYRKLSAFLARKGYSFDIISKVLKEVL